MQLVAAQMMSVVWNGPSATQLMKSSVVRNISHISRIRDHTKILLNCYVVNTLKFSVISLLQGYPTSSALPKSRVQTDVALPPPKKLAPAESVVKERLFVVFNPSPLPVDVLEDVFW